MNAPGQCGDAIGAVAELQGLYGPFAFPEKLLQKIWFRGDYDRSRSTTLDGRRVTILHGGKWNLLGGPDFKGARLRFGAEAEITGDVELHLRAGDWQNHAHASDPAYDNVILHVVLFPPAARHVTLGANGRQIPVLVLLPLLHHDLEEYAADDSVETLANRPAAQIVEILGPMPTAELVHLIERHAEERWRQKVHFARLRIRRLGWSAACHQTAVEILGYRFNRAPMLRIATAMPLETWAQGRLDTDAIFESEREGWSLQGLRPANHPRLRLRQYANWAASAADWPTRLAELGGTLPVVPPDILTGDARRAVKFVGIRVTWSEHICDGALGGGTRWDTMLCDGLFPLLAAHVGDDRAHALWYHWFCGDLPPLIPKALRQLQVFSGRSHPACHGAAQGLLGWLIERERTALSGESLST